MTLLGSTVKLRAQAPLGPDVYRATAMPIEYRVIDLASSTVSPDERIVLSTRPERAALEALGVEVVRSGAKRDLRARVYFQHPGQPLSMVRLYSKVDKAPS